jgi:hypothetical protein
MQSFQEVNEKVPRVFLEFAFKDTMQKEGRGIYTQSLKRHNTRHTGRSGRNNNTMTQITTTGGGVVPRKRAVTELNRPVFAEIGS